MKKITISDIELQMYKILKPLGLSLSNQELIVNHFLTAELSGKTTHGISKFCWESQYFKERLGRPFIEKDKTPNVLINANKEIGVIAAQYAIEVLEKRVRKHGIALVVMKNSQRYGALDFWAEKIAADGFIGVVMNTSEPVVPHPDGTTGVLGTNPIGIGIPTSEEPLVLDMATSKEAMGLTWQMMREGKKLPKNIFYDKEGKYTENPKLATAVEVFGEYKGFGLSLWIQVMSTILLGLPNEVKDKYEVGYVFLAVNPFLFASSQQFNKNIDQLKKRIKLSKRKYKNRQIILPGEHAKEKRQKALKKGFILLPEFVWKELSNNE